MSDRRPENPELADLRVAQHKGWYDDTWWEYRRATTEDLISAVRRGVESGTITGGIVDTESRAGFWLADHLNQFPPKSYLVIEVEQR